MDLVFFDDEIGTYVDRQDTENQVKEAGEFRQITRSTIDTLEIDAVISEEHSSSVDLTSHPVEKGVNITDHKRLKPREVTIEGVISDNAFLYDLDGAGSIEGRSVEALTKLEALQEGDKLIDIVTSLRTYQQMAIVDLTSTRDAKTGNILKFKALCRQVFTATSETVEAPPTPRPKSQALGKKQTTPAETPTKTSLAKKGLNALKAKAKSVLSTFGG